MKQTKDYTPEQIASAERMCKLINEIPSENRAFISTFMLAFMNGMEAGVMYAQEQKVTINGSAPLTI